MYTAQQIIDNRKKLWQEHGDIVKDKEYTNAVAKHIMDNPGLLTEIQDSPEHLIEMCFYIVDKDKQTVPFFLNPVQRDLADRIHRAKQDYASGKRLLMYFMVLKGRQQGCTAFITAYQTASTVINRNFEGFTAADEDGNTQAIFQNKAKFFYDRLPELIKPSEKFNNRKQLLFDKLNSSWEIKTASKNMARSRTVNFFHGSECAYWRDGISGVQAGLGEALTKSAIAIFESTANGFNEYKDLWDSGMYENIFYAWWLTQEYSQTFEDESKEKQFKNAIKTSRDGNYDVKQKEWVYQRCKWLLNDKRLTWQQIYWYHNKWAGYLNKELIKQEYPCSPDEAFLSSGSCIFNKEKIIQHKDRLVELYKSNPPKQGEFIITWNNPDIMDIPIAFRWVDAATGCIKIYEDVKPGVPYVIGGDTKGEGSDFFSGQVINNNTGKRCATLHGRPQSKFYTAQMRSLGMYYNTALIGIEMNWNTYPIELLTDWHYPRQYQREKTDTFTGEVKKAHGWKTDGNTRPLIIEREITLIEESLELITDIGCLNEMLTFVKKDDKIDAEPGKHDDILFADMIGEGTRGQQSRQVIVRPIDDEDEDEDDNRKDADNWFN